MEGIVFLLKKEFPNVVSVIVGYDPAEKLYEMDACCLRRNPVYEMMDEEFHVIVKGQRTNVLQELETKLRLLK